MRTIRMFMWHNFMKYLIVVTMLERAFWIGTNLWSCAKNCSLMTKFRNYSSSYWGASRRRDRYGEKFLVSSLISFERHQGNKWLLVIHNHRRGLGPKFNLLPVDSKLIDYSKFISPGDWSILLSFGANVVQHSYFLDS